MTRRDGRVRVARAAGLLMAVTLALAGCSSPTLEESTVEGSIPSDGPATEAAVSPSGLPATEDEASEVGDDDIGSFEPVTIENCGRTVTVEEPPERAVVMVVNTIELVLALGVQDQLVGTANVSTGVAEEYAAAFDQVEVLTEDFPSGEALLGVDADFVLGALEPFSFDPADGRGRDDLEARGIDTYALQCPDEQLTTDLLYQRIEEVAAIFGVPEDGAALAEQVRAQLTEAEELLGDVSPVDVLAYQGGEAVPQVLGGFGFGNVVLQLAGARNIFDDIESVFAEGSWEVVAERQPQAIIIQDFGDADVTESQAFLEDFPGIAGTPAVQDGRFVAVRASDMTFGVRAAEGVQQLARFLHPDEF